MAREILFKGKNLEDIKKMSFEEFTRLIPSRDRRSLKKGIQEKYKTVLKNLKKGKRDVKTHCRDMVIIPDMIGKTLRVHNGKEFIPVAITLEMLGHRLGEFALTRKRVVHSAPGIGATRSSASLSVK